jgi:hypothetical protein
VQEPVQFPFTPIALAITQLLALCPLLLAIARTAQLPSNVDDRYDVYQSLDTAPARMMLPKKADAFGVFLSDAQNTSDAQGGMIPQCSVRSGSLDTSQSLGSYMPSHQPEWMLSDDNSGLFKLADTQVRILCDCCQVSLDARNVDAL